MKEHLLDANNRTAFQGLIAAAVALGIGALLAGNLFDRSGARDRDVGLTVFEVFAVVAILTASFMTAFFSIGYLHAGEAVSDAQFGEVGAPLVVSLALLVLLRAAAKFSALPGGVGSHAPTAAVTVFAAVSVAIMVSYLASKPEYIVPGGGVILVAGALLGWCFLKIERFWLNGGRRAAQGRIASLGANGYEPTETSLIPAFPEFPFKEGPLKIVCWSRKERSYLDQTECRRLRAELNKRWAALAAGEAVPPLQDLILTRVELKPRFLPWPPKLILIVETSKRGEQRSRPHTLQANDAGLFDITDLGLV